LQKEAARVEALEVENAKLVAELEALRQTYPRVASEDDHDSATKGQKGNQRSPVKRTEYVDIEEYDRIKDQLAKSNEDYGKLVCARHALVGKVQHYKDMTKQWREYTNRWILDYPKKTPKALDAPSPSAALLARDLRFSSAPAPPLIPKGLTPSVSGSSKSTSPWTEVDDLQKQHRGPPPDHKMLSERIIATQMALGDALMASSGDLTEASDESEPQMRSSFKTRDHRGDLNPEPRGDEDNDSPIFVSERSLKRGRPNHVQDVGGRPRKTPKTEPNSSSPLPAAGAVGVNESHDSLDLDDVGGHVVTPRKRRKLEQMRLYSSILSSTTDQDKTKESNDATGGEYAETFMIKDEGSRRAIPSDGSVSSRLSKPAGGDCELINQELQRKLHRASLRAQQLAHNQRVRDRLEASEQHYTPATNLKEPVTTGLPDNSLFVLPSSPPLSAYPTPRTENPERPHTPQSRRETEQRRADLATPTVLQPTDPNAQILPRTNVKLTKQKLSCPPSRRDRGAAQVPALAEDGDVSPSTSHKTKPRPLDATVSSDKRVKVPDAHHRLEVLLGEPSPAKSILDTNSASHDKSRAPAVSNLSVGRSDSHRSSKVPITPLSIPAKRVSFETGVESKTDLKESRGAGLPTKPIRESTPFATKQSTAKPSHRRQPSPNSPADDQPEHEPLRARPLHRLRLDDFKLNPAHSDYAYHESVRKHDEKQAISGCTDRNCPRCKDIRKFVENSGYARVPGQDTAETDRRLMLEYLGGDTHQLDRMSAEDQKEILLQAKTKQFADKFGKHRTYFGRAPSPVDYWNTDFPTTQEHERNREAARVREREKVEEMYWEAIRKGGRYVFADE